MTTKTTATLTAADATREAIRRLVEDEMTTVTAKDVQPIAEALSPAVKDGYASFYLAAFAREGRVQRVSRGTYDVSQIATEAGVAPDAQAESGLTQDELEGMTKGELVQLAKDMGVQLKNVKNTPKAGIIQQLMAS